MRRFWAGGITALMILVLVLYISVPLSHSQASAPAFSTVTAPGDGATLAERRPLLKWTVFPNGNHIVDYKFWLDGVAVPAQLASEGDALLIVYRPAADLAAGLHTLECSVQFEGYKASSIAARFTISEYSIDPYSGQNRTALAGMEAETVRRLNQYRRLLGIRELTVNPALSRSAQAHSNYLSTNRIAGHYERQGTPGFTGIRPQDRAEYFGYSGQAGEGIDFGTPTAGLGVEALMDAPYHRLGHINPNYREMGAGFSLNPGNTVINYGTTGAVDNEQVMLYPYPGQGDAKIAWLAVEMPNPLAYYGLDRVYVGYPISMSLHDNQTAELRIRAASIQAGGGGAVPFYLVDSAKEAEQKTHVFLIPEQPLTPGRTYTVAIQADRILRNGTVIPLVKNWSFTTQKELAIAYAGIIRLGGADNLEIRLKNGSLPDMGYVLTQGGQIIRKYMTGRGYSWSGYTQLAAGIYELEIASAFFPPGKKFTLQLTETDYGKTVRIID